MFLLNGAFSIPFEPGPAQYVFSVPEYFSLADYSATISLNVYTLMLTGYKSESMHCLSSILSESFCV